MPPRRQSAGKRARGKGKQTSLLDFKPRKRGRRPPAAASGEGASAETRGGASATSRRPSAAATRAANNDDEGRMEAQKAPSKKRGRPSKSASSVSTSAAATVTAVTSITTSDGEKSTSAATEAKPGASDAPSRKRRGTVFFDVVEAKPVGTTQAKEPAIEVDSTSTRSAVAANRRVKTSSVTPSPELPAKEEAREEEISMPALKEGGESDLASAYFPQGRDAVFELSCGGDEACPDDEQGAPKRGKNAQKKMKRRASAGEEAAEKACGGDASDGSTGATSRKCSKNARKKLTRKHCEDRSNDEGDEVATPQKDGAATKGGAVGGKIVSEEKEAASKPKTTADPTLGRPLLQQQQLEVPVFHQPWKEAYAPAGGSLPAGVIDIDSLPHRCCDHSLQSHTGYSWLTSKRRCGCALDSDHCSSESMTEAYLAGYGAERYGGGSMADPGKGLDLGDWRAEERWLAQTRKEIAGSTRTPSPTSSLSDTSSISDGAEAPSTKVVLPTSVAEHLDYISRQPNITVEMRRILADWLCEVAEEYKLSSEALWLSVALVDRSLACFYGQRDGKKKSSRVESEIGGEMVVPKDKLQLVGCACTLVASKLVEIAPPTADDFVYISDKTYSRKEVLDMESRVAGALKFNMNFRTPHHYVDRFLRASYASSECSTAGSHDALVMMGGGRNNANNVLLKKMVHYLLDLAMLEYKLVSKKPSLVAASAVYLARATLGIRQPTTSTCTTHVPLFGGAGSPTDDPYLQRALKGFWSKTLEFYTGYDIWGLEECVRLLHRLQEGAEESNLASVFNKHKQVKQRRVALRTVVNESELGFL